MKIVIDIPDFLYQIIQDCKVIEGTNEGNLENVLVKAVENGVVLPKGHGDIVDIETLRDMFWDGNSMEITKYDLSVIEPIIEADKESEE